MMAPRKDISWHGEFLRLVRGGLSFKVAVGKLGVSTATLTKHFQADPAFHSTAHRLRHRRLYGPPIDTSWHPRLPPLLASGLSIPRAAIRIGRSEITVRNHLRRFTSLRTAVNEALRQAGRPPLYDEPAPPAQGTAEPNIADAPPGHRAALASDPARSRR
ncbi:hypothetical protein Ssi03_62860 [Sphaerisporangium siamense]|uniref:Uncharacterized protein n=1 Tax=Sphaerisporangium siamense TaxID=795645 RepID=A0A7W7GBM7_9ACTN|nr:hypothetical protein [Sphaerisporangium siamense]MBB4702594.1 hypothetical protein [Sphaerisporangium siamense]GII88296.1 hypothetical protein Ssi03_62860 [Sphaerisporangium siamense]